MGPSLSGKQSYNKCPLQSSSCSDQTSLYQRSSLICAPSMILQQNLITSDHLLYGLFQLSQSFPFSFTSFSEFLIKYTRRTSLKTITVLVIPQLKMLQWLSIALHKEQSLYNSL